MQTRRLHPEEEDLVSVRISESDAYAQLSVSVVNRMGKCARFPDVSEVCLNLVANENYEKIK